MAFAFEQSMKNGVALYAAPSLGPLGPVIHIIAS
jgi:hypothetical protein